MFHGSETNGRQATQKTRTLRSVKKILNVQLFNERKRQSLRSKYDNSEILSMGQKLMVDGLHRKIDQ
jgi:hypothetical protein